VTSATLDSDQKVAGIFELKHAVGELGAALAGLAGPAGKPTPCRNHSAMPRSPFSESTPSRRRRQQLFRRPSSASREKSSTTARSSRRSWPANDAARNPARFGDPAGGSFIGSNFCAFQMTKPDDLQFARDDFNGFDERAASRSAATCSAGGGQLLAPDLLDLGVSIFIATSRRRSPIARSHLRVDWHRWNRLPFTLTLVDAQNRRLAPSATTARSSRRSRSAIT
jgi:hypothetical protein